VSTPLYLGRHSAATVTLTVLVLVTMLASLGGRAPSLGAQESGGDPRPGAGGLRLTDRTVVAGDQFTLGVRLPGVIEDTDKVVISVRDRVDSLSDFNRRVDNPDGEELGNWSFTVAELAPAADGRTSITLELGPAPDLPGDDQGADQVPTPRLELGDPGVYPVVVTLTNAEEVPLGELVTHLVTLGNPAVDRIRRTVVTPFVDFDVFPALTATGALQPGDSTSVWAQTLILNPDVPVSVRISPILLDRLTDSDTIERLTERLASANVVATSYVPVDELALELAGLQSEREELFSWGTRTIGDRVGIDPSTTLWAAPDGLSDREAGVLRQRGVRQVLLGGDNGVALTTPIEVNTPEGTLDALVVRPDMSVAGGFEDPVLAAHRVLAQLAVLGLDGEPHAAALMYRTAEPVDPVFSGQLFSGLAESAPVFDVAALPVAFTVPGPVDSEGRPLIRNLVRDTQPDRLEGDLDLYRRAADTLEGYRSMIKDEDTVFLYDDLHDRLLLSLASGVTGDQREITWSDTIDSIKRETSAIVAPPIRSINLTSREAVIPLSFQNTAPYPMRVKVRFLSDKVRFVDLDDGESTTIRLEPGVTNQEFSVEVLSAGSFPMDIQVLSPDGRLQLRSVSLTIRANTPSGVGILLTVGAGAVLVLWWGRELLRRKTR